MKHPLTIILTSCNRFDLLCDTLDSFFALNKYPYVAFHIHNDSELPIPQLVKTRYWDRNITWHEGVKRGLSASWDYLVAKVETEYFFNMEDDWLFYNNPFFIQHSIDLLEYYDQVWIRSKTDHTHPLSQHLVGNYQIVKQHGDWCGFSFNPGVRKKSEWIKFFPNGIGGKDEIEISRELKGRYTAVSLAEPSIRHIGNGRHSQDFKI